MSASEIDRTLVRLAHEILEKTAQPAQLVLVGIKRRGVPLADRLAKKIAEIEHREIPVGSVDIERHRDDQTRQTVTNGASLPFSVNGKDVVLVDDVLHTGRTVRAGLEALLEYGRPARVQLLVLVDRGHRELPIEARYVGRTVQTKAAEVVDVKLMEIDGMEKVVLAERAN